MAIRSGIRGVSENPRPPRLGHIRLGIKTRTASGVERPQRIDYFALDDDETGRALRDFLVAQGQPKDKPISIPIQFVSDDPDEVAPYNLEFYGNGVRKCIGNGVTAEAIVDPKAYAAYMGSTDGEPPRTLWASGGRTGDRPLRREIRCLGAGYDDAPACPIYGNGCGPTMHLRFVVRGFPMLGIWEITTGSAMNIDRVRGFLAFLRGVNDGRLTGVAIQLGLDTVNVRGQRYSVLRFDIRPGEAKAGSLVTGASAPAMLPDGGDEPTDSDDAPFGSDYDGIVQEQTQDPEAAEWDAEIVDDHPTRCPHDGAELQDREDGWSHITGDSFHIVEVRFGRPVVRVHWLNTRR